MTNLLRSKFGFPDNCGMKSTGAESTRIVEVLEELVVNEPKLPIGWQLCFHVHKVRSIGHIKSDFKLRWTVAIGYYLRGKDLNLWNQDFSSFQNSELCVFVLDFFSTANIND